MDRNIEDMIIQKDNDTDRKRHKDRKKNTLKDKLTCTETEIDTEIQINRREIK